MSGETDSKPTRDRTRARARRPWEAEFLRALRDTGNPTRACRAAGISRAQVYRLRDSDPAFAEMWEAATEESVDTMEAEARRRAVVGTPRPVYQGGAKVGDVREYSDRMLLALLRRHRPEMFREHFDAEKVAAAVLKAMRTSADAAP